MSKTRIIVLCSILSVLLIASGLFAGEVMRITRKDRTTVDIPLSEIDNIQFLGGSAPVAMDQPRDGDGNVYKTVRIGNQVWMAENLRTTKFMDGTPIKEIRGNNNDWTSVKEPAMCWPNNDPDNYAKIYGGYYNWDAVNSGKLAPAGWRIPTMEDYEILLEYLGKDTTAGPKLATSQKGHWNNIAGSNESGFNAYPGYRNRYGMFHTTAKGASFWTSTLNFRAASEAASLEIVSDAATMKAYMSYSGRAAGLAVRFIKE